MTGYKYQSFAKGAYKVIVDIDVNEMNKFNIVADLKIHSDSAEFLRKLICLTQDDSLQIEQWRKYCKELRSNEQYVFEKHRNYKGFASNYCFVEGLSNLVPEQSLLQNDYTRPWMADWALAESKMMLGEARSKYSSGLPGPGGAVQLNGEALKQEAASDKERLLQSIINMEEGNRNYGFIIG